MKTKEFIEKVSKLGYKAKQGQMGTSVYNETSCCTMAMVSEDYENRVNIYHASDDLFDTIVAYAKTPISERKSIIRKRVKVVSTDENSYLHVDVFSWGQRAYLGRLVDEDLTSVIDDFTPEQIEQLKSRDDIAIDWNKVKLEEAN